MYTPIPEPPFGPVRAFASGRTRGRRKPGVTSAAVAAAWPDPPACEPCPERFEGECDGEAGCEVICLATDGSPLDYDALTARDG